MEIFETVCHNVTLYNKTVTCMCLDTCGGSMEFRNTFDASVMNVVRVWARLTASGQLSRYPAWLTKVVEDYAVFKDACKCGIFDKEEWSKFNKKVYDSIYAWVCIQIAYLFYPSLPLLASNLYLAFVSFFNLFYPLFFSLSIFNIAIVYRLRRGNDSTAFTLQSFQFVANMLSILFLPSWFYVFVSVIFYAYETARMTLYYQVFFTAFVLWSQMLSVALTSDRVFCMYNPIGYKHLASTKKARLVALGLLLISFIISAISIISDTTDVYLSKILVQLVLHAIMSFVLFACLVGNFVLITVFVIIVRKKVSLDKSVQLKKRQKHINRMMIGTACVESLLCLCHIMGIFARTLLYISAYQSSPNYADYVSFTTNVLLLSPVFIGLLPFVSLCLCLFVSSIYRQSFFSFFRSKYNTSTVVSHIS